MHKTFFRHTTIALFTSFALLAGLFVILFWNVLTAEVALLPVAGISAANEVSLPTRIAIPSIALDAPIEIVGLKTDGSMDVPKDPMNVGWFAFGPRPGEHGSAALAGHVNWWYGKTGVFANLAKVQPGDIVTIEGDDGSTKSFIVRKLQIFDAAADATTVFTSNDGIAHLNLITCDGVWNTGTQQYAKRLVVFTDEVLE